MRTLTLCLLAMLFCSGQTCTEPDPASDLPGDEQVAGDTPDDPASDPDDDDSPMDDSENAPPDPEPDPDDTPDEEPDPAPDTGAAPCYTGEWTCQLGPEPVACGVWQFVIDDENVVTGTGSITQGFTEPVNLDLSGGYDPDGDALALDLTSETGNGLLVLDQPAGDQDLTGSWSHTLEPGPDAASVAGTTVASPCDP